MCNRYAAPSADDIHRHWALPDAIPPVWGSAPVEVFPRSAGPFICKSRLPQGGAPALVVGQWGLIPDFAASRTLPYSTNNARSEELAHKASFQRAWAQGQRCLIPAWHFDEPCWETGRNVWWRFHRRDGRPWGLAGLWNQWLDPASGELVESYTMLTLNADAHPLMSRMHKPDPALPAHRQDKRSVIAIEHEDADAWLHGDSACAQSLLRLTEAQAFEAGPLNPPAQLSLL